MLQLDTSARAIVCAIVALISLFFNQRSRRDSLRFLLGPLDEAHWLWGNELAVFKTSYEKYFKEWFERYGLVFRYRAALGHPDILAVADPRAVQHIFSANSYAYTKSSFYGPLLERMVGRGLVWAEGEHHKRQRKGLNAAFSLQAIKDMAPTVLHSASMFQQRLAQCVEENNGEASLNILSLTSSFTLDVICKTGFAYDSQFGSTPEALEIRREWSQQIDMALTMTGFYGQVFVRKMPRLASLPLQYFEKQRRVHNVVSKLSRQFLHERSGQPQEGDKCMLSLILKLKEDGLAELTEQEVIDNIVTFVMGGFDSSSGTLAMILWELARNQDVQQRLRMELISLEREPTYDDLSSSDVLPYLDAVIKEGLRTHTGVISVERVALTDDVLPLSQPIRTSSGTTLSEIHVRAGQVFTFPLIAMSILEPTWKDGPVFRPERWLEEDGLPAKDDLFKKGFSGLASFIMGPRMCIGYNLAILDLKAALAALIPQFLFYDTGVDIETRNCTTGQPVVVGKADDGVQLPLRVTYYEE